LIVTMREFLAGEFIDIIEWLDETSDTMVWRFDRPQNEIKNGAQLIVRPGQVAVFVEQGDIADVFEPGRHVLTTMNLPLLSKLRGWKYGFESPFKAEIVFVSTKQFVNQKWGTSNPVIVRDSQLGTLRLRAFGTYALRVENPPQFVRELAGTNSVFIVDQVADQLRDLVVSNVSTCLADGNVPVTELSAKYRELGARVLERATPSFKQYGLELTQLVVENVSLPAEVEAAIDQQARVNVVGGLDRYTQVQSADALRDAARNPSGGAAAGVGIGMGAAVAQRAMTNPQTYGPPAATPESYSGDEPPPLPQDKWYYAVAGERRGPVPASALVELVAAGTVTDATLVWKRGMKDWAHAATLAELAPMLASRRG
jgi:membrane protease subunit (stomatin/prohibitin family)